MNCLMFLRIRWSSGIRARLCHRQAHKVSQAPLLLVGEISHDALQLLEGAIWRQAIQRSKEPWPTCDDLRIARSAAALQKPSSSNTKLHMWSQHWSFVQHVLKSGSLFLLGIPVAAQKSHYCFIPDCSNETSHYCFIPDCSNETKRWPFIPECIVDLVETCSNKVCDCSSVVFFDPRDPENWSVSICHKCFHIQY